MASVSSTQQSSSISVLTERSDNLIDSFFLESYPVSAVSLFVRLRRLGRQTGSDVLSSADRYSGLFSRAARGAFGSEVGKLAAGFELHAKSGRLRSGCDRAGR